MAVRNQKQRSVQLHDFAMSPAADVPRSQFNLSHGKKLAFNFSDLTPILVEFALPGDTWNATFNMAARTAVPVVPVQDNWRWNAFSFFVPMRLVWANAHKFWGEQLSPGDSIAFTIPQLVSPAGGYAVASLQDYMGLPTAGQVLGGNTITHNVLPLRAYNLIYNEWFRDENLQNYIGPAQPGGDGPDALGSFALLQRGKRFDYITQALPWPQKGNTAVALPIGISANVKAQSTEHTTTGTNAALKLRRTDTNAIFGSVYAGGSGLGELNQGTSASGGAFTPVAPLYPTNLYADLTGATGTTLNAFRTAVAMQQYLERDARMGTRYTEFVWGMFRVRTADARLNRPEFIGAGGGDVLTTAIPQTSATGLTGGTTPAGTLAASGYAGGGGGFTYSCSEHGYIITLVAATVDITYSQGMRKMWSVSTRYDYPVPLLANLGEQAMANREIYCDGSANDALTFGYVPRWDEYRTIPSQISGIYKPRAAGNIAYWHSSENFAALPALNSAFITDQAKTVVQRNFSAGASSLGQQLLADVFFNIRCARALPLYGIPGLTRL